MRAPPSFRYDAVAMRRKIRKIHRFVRRPDGNARKRKRDGTKFVRIGARNPGGQRQGSIRRPF